MSLADNMYPMKTILVLASLFLSGSAFSQANEQPLIIAQNVLSNGISQQQALYAILAYNQIQPRAIAHYQAGQAITLQPGFVAQAGSVFEATIDKVSLGKGEPSLSVRALGNPVTGSQAQVEISGVMGQSVNLRLVDQQGRAVYEERIEQAGQVESVRVPLAQSRGTLLLNVSTANQQQSLKLLRP